jgi:hypothetical protein
MSAPSPTAPEQTVPSEAPAWAPLESGRISFSTHKRLNVGATAGSAPSRTGRGKPGRLRFSIRT